MTFNFDSTVRVIKTCAACCHALEFCKGVCICNGTREIKFLNSKCTCDKLFNNEIRRVRKLFVTFTIPIEKSNPFTKDTWIVYRDSGLALYCDTNAVDDIALKQLRHDISEDFIKQGLENKGLKYDKNIMPVIFAEKVNGIWKQVFFKYSDELSSFLFNNLQ